MDCVGICPCCFLTGLSVWRVYALNPITVMSCVGCSYGSLGNLVVLMSIYGGLTSNTVVTGVSLAAAVYLDVQFLLFTVKFTVHT